MTVCRICGGLGWRWVPGYYGRWIACPRRSFAPDEHVDHIHGPWDRKGALIANPRRTAAAAKSA